ncbi:hypothetical protein F5Y10DRAFT_268993 [Nemania abortiva]|nr:hypothetical protein F5Y10DRAFT_268993 [Nemania abortiva]
MSSSQGSPSSAEGNNDATNSRINGDGTNGGVGREGNEGSNHENSPAGDNNSHDCGHGERHFEPWRSKTDQNEEDDEIEQGDDENDELYDDGDDSSEVGPEILNDISDGEDEGQGSSSRRRARKSKPRSGECRNCDQIRRRWNREANRLTEQLEATRYQLNARIRELESEIERLKARGRIQWQPWAPRLADLQESFRRFDLEDEDEDTPYPGYGPIYLDSCRQGNMSIHLDVTHPDLFLQRTPHTPAQIQAHFREEMLRDRYNGLNDLGGVYRSVREIIFPLRCTRLNPLRFLENAPFPFENLPVSIQCHIWKYLIPSDKLMHCLSRLDPCNPPLDYRPGGIHFPSRFHMGDTPCCVATADKPSRYLDYLLVSKRWYYATAHLFYATNTFAFSSFGEFGRFCEGIGRQRVERLVHVEIMWKGALTPRQDKGVSLRKQPLAWFMHTRRLRTLVVHINESEKNYMRRPYEMMHPKDYYEDFAADDVDEDELDIFGMEVRRTNFQPNYRKYRSMRTVQGMDFIYQLRGMRWVRFYDTYAGRANARIHDWSFTQDVNNVAKRPKTDAATFKAEIENLRPLTGLADYIPDDETRELVLRFYDDTLTEDVTTHGSETSSSSGISRVHTISDDSDSGSGTDRSPRGSSRSRGSSPNSRIEIEDSDTEMGDDDNAPHRSSDNDPQPQDIDIPDAVSDSSRTRRSSSGSTNSNPDDTGATTAASPRHPIIVIEDDDANDNIQHHKNRGGYHSTDSGLFVRSGSCTAHDDTHSSGEEKAVRSRKSTTFVDLTGDDENEANDEGEVEEVSNPNNGDEKEKSIKLEESSPRSRSGSSKSDSDSDASNPQKRPGSKHGSD